jgi:two-component system C4-dicarboxylate transport sensor histidine kinase DctB
MLPIPVLLTPGKFTTSDLWRLLFYATGVLAVILLTVFWSVRVAALHDHLADSQKQLALYAAHVTGELAKYQAIPALLATNQRVRKVLEQPQNLSARQALNEYFEHSAQTSQALAIYLMNREGVTQAASNWRPEERSFIGENFAYRPYFQQALQGNSGRYFALGTTSTVRGYYFAEPVYQLGQVIGVVVVKLDISVLEQRWRGARQQVFVTDADGVVFIATQSDWLYHTWLPLSAAQRHQIRQSQRYPGQSLPSLNKQIAGQFKTASLVQIADHPTHDYLHVQQPMPTDDWQLHVLNPLDRVDNRAWQAIWVALAICGIGLLGITLVWQRQQYHAQARQVLEQAHEQLEQRVRTRTADLQHEIEERQRAETALRTAQDKLIQAAKLAMLGQLSASVAHELNQPLSAIRSYAGNAQLLLQRDASAAAAANLTEITQLVERMTRISAQLKQFARKSSGACVPVSLSAAIQMSTRLWQRETEQAGVTVQVADTNLQVMADSTRLEQVLVNLIGNALQALVAAHTPQPRIHIQIQSAEGLCYVTVSDNGPGIPEAQLTQIFDPFFTTRQAGLGLGLAISQQIIEHTGGTLTVAQSTSGGAAFTFSVPLA